MQSSFCMIQEIIIIATKITPLKYYVFDYKYTIIPQSYNPSLNMSVEDVAWRWMRVILMVTGNSMHRLRN